jgi:predicted RNA-binding Zn-ribbon protein involved in translation (DUF1610 family)
MSFLEAVWAVIYVIYWCLRPVIWLAAIVIIPVWLSGYIKRKRKEAEKHYLQEKARFGCPKCGRLQKTFLRTSVKNKTEHVRGTRASSRRHHYNADGDYRGYSETEEDYWYTQTVTETSEECQCSGCGNTWERLVYRSAPRR